MHATNQTLLEGSKTIQNTLGQLKFGQLSQSSNLKIWMTALSKMQGPRAIGLRATLVYFSYTLVIKVGVIAINRS